MDSNVTQVDGWSFEVKTVFGRKTDAYGEPYEGIITLTVVNGEVHAEGLLCDDFDSKDYKTLVKYVKDHLGIKSFKYKRFYGDKEKTINKHDID